MMRNKRAWQVITAGGGLLLAVWLLFACVAPPGAPPVASRSVGVREVDGETCQTFTSTDVPKAIPDEGDEIPVGSFTVSKLRAPMPGYITDLTVTFTIDHEYPRDLNVVFCGPRNLHCDILSNVLTRSEGVYTLAFSSDPTRTWSNLLAGPPYSGTYPAYPYNFDDGLLKFRNAAAAGEWWLGFLDESGGDEGTLTAWSLELCTTPIKNTATPGPTPAPTATRMYACDKDQFVAESLGASNPCNCSDPLFQEAPDSDSGTTEINRTWVMCAPGCNYGTSAFSVVGDLRMTTYAQAAGDYFGFYGYATCNMSTNPWDPPYLIGEDSTSCDVGDCTGSGCSTRSCTQDQTAEVDFLGFPGVSFNIQNGAADGASCSAPASNAWSYAVTWGACVPQPTATPWPTDVPPTRPCPTAIVPQGGWWMW